MTQKSKNKGKKLYMSQKSSIFASYFAQTCAYVRIRETWNGEKIRRINAKKGDIHNVRNVVIGDTNDSARRCGN